LTPEETPIVGEGSVFQRKDGRWCAKYEDAKGKTRYIYRKTKGEAKQALRHALKDRDNSATFAERRIYGGRIMLLNLFRSSVV
jgi:hypothetical protein